MVNANCDYSILFRYADDIKEARQLKNVLDLVRHKYDDQPTRAGGVGRAGYICELAAEIIKNVGTDDKDLKS